jgi:hypothetical protein
MACRNQRVAVCGEGDNERGQLPPLGSRATCRDLPEAPESLIPVRLSARGLISVGYVGGVDG